MDAPSILPILKKIPLFEDLSEDDHKEIIKNITMNYYPAGHIFCTEGESGQEGAMYILKTGAVKITRKGNFSREEEIAQLGPEQFFGEMALVLNEPRNATATATADCEVFELKKGAFMAPMQSSKTMSNKISTEFIERVKKNNKTV